MHGLVWHLASQLSNLAGRAHVSICRGCLKGWIAASPITQPCMASLQLSSPCEPVPVSYQTLSAIAAYHAKELPSCIMHSFTNCTPPRAAADQPSVQDTAVVLGRQQERLEAEVSRLDAQEARLAVIVDQVQACQAAPAATPLEQLCSAYDGLLREAPEEYVLYGISAAALAQVLPGLGLS